MIKPWDDPLKAEQPEDRYLVDVAEVCGKLCCKGYRAPMYGCVNYFELLKVNDANEPVDSIWLTEHFMDEGDEGYGRYYVTDAETYGKIREWIESAFDGNAAAGCLGDLNRWTAELERAEKQAQAWREGEGA